MRKYFREKEDFRDNYVGVGKGVTLPFLCSSVDVLSLSHIEKIPSEYSNNRNLLIRKIDLVQQDQCLQLSTH